MIGSAGGLPSNARRAGLQSADQSRVSESVGWHGLWARVAATTPSIRAERRLPEPERPSPRSHRCRPKRAAKECAPLDPCRAAMRTPTWSRETKCCAGRSSPRALASTGSLAGSLPLERKRMRFCGASCALTVRGLRVHLQVAVRVRGRRGPGREPGAEHRSHDRRAAICRLQYGVVKRQYLRGLAWDR